MTVCVSLCVFLRPLVSYALLVFVASCGDQVRFHGCGKPIAPGDDTLERGNLQRPRVGQKGKQESLMGPLKVRDKCTLKDQRQKVA